MAITNKLITFNKLTSFETQLAQGNILETSIVFIKDAKKIWTKGTYFDCSGGNSDANVQAVDTGDVLDDVNVDYATKIYVDGLVEDINNILENINGGGGSIEGFIPLSQCFNNDFNNDYAI